jgi:phenylpropionate dioxygenase-like ring-hydroxylating dioxygenase large terminal subunit
MNETTAKPIQSDASAMPAEPRLRSEIPIKKDVDEKVQTLLERGLRNLWYPICPSEFVGDQPVSLRRLGYKLVLWRDKDQTIHALEDHCPHRGAPLSQGVNLGDRIACPYHGVEVRFDGVVARVPASPGCAMEGQHAAISFHVKEVQGAIWLYNPVNPRLAISPPPTLRLPKELTDPEYSSFLCYTEWRGSYRYVLDNVIDPMHGTFLHRQSHSMSEGDISAKFQLRRIEDGFRFEKIGQVDVNFDWTEWCDTGTHWMRLEIPYPKTGGPGGNFIIIGSYTPITPNLAAVFHWRVRKVSGWERDAWRFLYRNRLEQRHWKVLEQDRHLLENMEPDARLRENLYEHDIGVSRLRRHLETLALKELQGL